MQSHTTSEKNKFWWSWKLLIDMGTNFLLGKLVEAVVDKREKNCVNPKANHTAIMQCSSYARSLFKL